MTPHLSSNTILFSRVRSPAYDLVLAGMVFLFMLLSEYSSRQESVTNDEFRHLSTGIYYLQGGDYSFDCATPPLWKMVMALPAYLSGAKTVQLGDVPAPAGGWEPWFVATDFMRENAAAYTGYLQAARRVNILAAAACLIYLYRRSKQRFGAAAALYGTAFLAFSPTLLAHSHYATTDVISAATMMVTVFMLVDYVQRPHYWRLMAAALLFSLSLLCKFTALLIFPLLLAMPLLCYWRKGLNCIEAPFWRRRSARVAVSTLGAVLQVLLVILLTVNLIYGCRGTGVRLKDLPLASKSLSALSNTVAGSVPLPLPTAFVLGFDHQKADSDYGEFPAYFNGRWSRDGFWYYYPAALVLKESVPFVLLLLTALAALLLRRGAVLSRTELLIFCYVPASLFFVLCFLNRLNVGVRYLLPAYPFFCFLISRFHAEVRSGKLARLVLPALFVVHCLSVLRIAPCYTAYFNELGGGAENGYQTLVDSNLDWGQDLLRLKKYLSAQGIKSVQLAYFGHGLPEFYGIDYEPLAAVPKPGYVAISATLLQGQPYLLTYLSPPQFAEFDQFRFMRTLQPIAKIGYSMMIYRIN